MRILIVSDPGEPLVYEIIEEYLEADPRIEISSMSMFDPVPHNLKTYDLCVFWLQDPCDDRPDVFGRALGLADLCAVAGVDVPVINHPDALPHSRKSETARLLLEAGLDLRVPRMDVLTEPRRVRELPLPLFVREDAQHAADLFRVDSSDQITSEFLDRIAKMQEPIAVEYIDIKRGDFYRKYRYAVAGNTGVPMHLQMSREWITRGETAASSSPEIVPAEKDFLAQPNSCPVLHEAAKVLGFDFCAFDYGYDLDGRLVVWEVNPFPSLHFAKRDYHRAATERVLAAVVAMYFARARK